jgi:hypothetical protein
MSKKTDAALQANPQRGDQCGPVLGALPARTF